MGELFEDLWRPETYQALLAELIGTGLLTLTALLAGTPYAVALILAALVYALGPISGAQLNPAVTLGLLVSRKVTPLKGVLYLVAQVGGALLARRIAPALGDLGTYRAGQPVGEFVGAGLLVLAVAAVVAKQVPEAGGGVAIGAALGAGLLLSGGVLNPAVALAMGLGVSPAVWAAALGGIAFAALFDLLAVKPDQQQPQQAGDAEQQAPPSRTDVPPTRATPAFPHARTIAPATIRNPDPVAAARQRTATIPARTARPGGNPRAGITPSRVSAPRAHSFRSSIVGLLTLPFALIGLILRTRRAAMHPAAPARRATPTTSGWQDGGE